MKVDNEMGNAFLWRTDRVEPASDQGLQSGPYLKEDGSPMNQIWASEKFIHLPSQKDFIVMTTHLKAKKGFEEMRGQQASQLASVIPQNEQRVIVCGDFNDEPNSLAY